MQEYVLTAAFKKLLLSLPARVLQTIERLSRETGESFETIVEHGVELYRKRATSKLTGRNDELAKIMKDPVKRAIFDEITQALGKRSSSSLTPAQKKARAIAGGNARAATLSPQRRKEIATAASNAATRKRKEKQKQKSGGGSKPGPVT